MHAFISNNLLDIMENNYFVNNGLLTFDTLTPTNV